MKEKKLDPRLDASVAITAVKNIPAAKYQREGRKPQCKRRIILHQ